MNEPKTLNEVILSDLVRSQLKAILDKKSGFYLLHSSETGTGKTTCANIIAEHVSIKTSNNDKSSYRYFDCSNPKIANNIIDKVNDELMTLNLNSSHRVVVLDEADKLTKQNRLSLASIYNDFFVKKNSSELLVVLVANDVENFDKSLISRCESVCFSNQDTDSEVINVIASYIDSSRFSNTENALKTLKAAKSILLRTSDIRKTMQYVARFLDCGVFDAKPLLFQTK